MREQRKPKKPQPKQEPHISEHHREESGKRQENNDYAHNHENKNRQKWGS